MKKRTSLSGIRTLDYIIQLSTEPKLSFISKNSKVKNVQKPIVHLMDVKVYNLF